MVTRLQVCWQGAPLPRCDPSCGQRVGAESFSLSELKDAKIDAPEPCALSADVDGARRFENTGLYHVPELHNELDGAGDPLRGRRGRGWSSSSTFSRVQARCRSSACAARAEAGGSHDSFVSLFFDRCEDHSTRFHRVTFVSSIVWGLHHMHAPLHVTHSLHTRVPLVCMVGFL